MPDVVDGKKITASPDQLRTAGQEWGTKANDYDQMNLRLQAVSAKLPPGKFQGRAGDTVRGYLRELTSSSGKLAEAYNKIAIKAPRVADAIRDAKHAQDRLETAQDEADDARRKLDTARIELVAAEAAVSAQRGIHDVLGIPGPSAAAKQAVERARQRVSDAEHVVTAKDKAVRKARTDFHDADHDRKRISHDFAELVNEQTGVIRKALPPAPAAPQVPALASQLGVLNLGRGAFFTLFGAQMNLGVRRPEQVASRQERPVPSAQGREGVLAVRSADVGNPGQVGWAPGQDRQGRRHRRAAGGEQPRGVQRPAPHPAAAAGLHRQSRAARGRARPRSRLGMRSGGCVRRGRLRVCRRAGREGAEKSHLARRATNGFSHIAVNPYVETGSDIAHGHYVEGLKDGALIWPRIGLNAITQGAPTPSRIKGIVDDAGHDAKGVADFVDKQHQSFLNKLGDGLRGGFIRGI